MNAKFRVEDVDPQSFKRLKRVASRLSSLIENQQDSAPFPYKDYVFLKDCYSRTTCPSIDYNRYAAAFNQAFFLKNYWKTVFSFARSSPVIAKSILDLGSGSGSTIIGYLAWLNTCLNDCQWEIGVTLIDRSVAQLEFAQRIFEALRPELEHLALNLEFETLDLSDWSPEVNSRDVVLIGHVLNENVGIIQEILEKAYSCVKEGGQIFIVERPNQELLWKSIEKKAANLALPVFRETIEVPSKQLVTGSSFHYPGKESLVNCFMSIKIPEHKRLVSLTKMYFEAWRDTSDDLLDEVFSPQAIYQEKPFQEPLIGIETIKQYWRDNVLTQHDVELQILRVAYSGNLAMAEWEVGFNTGSQTRRNVKGVILLEYDPNVDRVFRLDEYFRTQTKCIPDGRRKLAARISRKSRSISVVQT